MNRSAATVGAQYGPAPSSGSGSGIPAAISPAAAASSRISPSRCSSTPVSLVSRLTSRTPRPPLRSSGTGAAPRVSSTNSTSRSRSMTAPAATASTSAAVVVDTDGIGRGQLDRSGHLRRAAPDRPAAAGSRCRRRPAAAGPRPAAAAPAGPAACPAPRRGFCPSASPPSGARSRSRCAVVERREPFGDLVGGVLGPFEDGLAGIPGQARRGLGGDPDLGSRPTPALARAGHRGRRRRRPRRRGRRSGRRAWSAARAWFRRAASAAHRAPPAAESPARRWRP